MLRIRSDKKWTYFHSSKAQTKLDLSAHWYGLEYDLNEAVLSSGYTTIEHPYVQIPVANVCSCAHRSRPV